MALRDRFNRLHDDLRVSVTDRCNLRCSYCMPEEPVWFPRDQILDYEEMHRLIQVLVEHGVRKVRVTGGEPLVRKDLTRFISLLAGSDGIEDISLTTNGVLLEAMARPLADAGLTRVNVSLDTLDPARFRQLTRRDDLDKVLAGLDAAAASGLTPLKINTVLLKGINEDEAERFVETARDKGWEVRFIEFMPLENSGTWDLSQVVTGKEVLERLRAHWDLDPDPSADPSAPASRFLFRDGRGRVGFINSISQPFCGDCSRLRLTADGKFRVCLYDQAEIDLKTPLRQGATDGELAGLIHDALQEKGRGGALEILERQEPLPGNRTMHQIGG
ncbi:MAG: GTP 3',8-cyclase MoaA [Acidobacteria bacterium]|uniref:GTP 3',8-cyclase n=1 Tax=Candidatus Polarisedimenticola svalbardensis TaxID=2886004 RepID=A0A8J6XU88_9BACT|nr:GTP 3',8-cyclase MoaA [Candidatus Polarisedimenticola svalbardensis]